tara:strand:+ start:11909 stop:12952 length:1044 start_codon:yes stop_codon:yes gene_type:complete
VSRDKVSPFQGKGSVMNVGMEKYQMQMERQNANGAPRGNMPMRAARNAKIVKRESTRRSHEKLIASHVIIAVICRGHLAAGACIRAYAHDALAAQTKKKFALSVTGNAFASPPSRGPTMGCALYAARGSSKTSREITNAPYAVQERFQVSGHLNVVRAREAHLLTLRGKQYAHRALKTQPLNSRVQIPDSFAYATSGSITIFLQTALPANRGLTMISFITTPARCVTLASIWTCTLPILLSTVRFVRQTFTRWRDPMNAKPVRSMVHPLQDLGLFANVPVLLAPRGMDQAVVGVPPVSCALGKTYLCAWFVPSVSSVQAEITTNPANACLGFTARQGRRRRWVRSVL